MSQLVFFLEEPSAQDLEKQIVRRLRGYQVPGARFMVLRDKDAADCHIVKEGLVEKCRDAGRPDAVVRIACHELEKVTGYRYQKVAGSRAIGRHLNPANTRSHSFRIFVVAGLRGMLGDSVSR